MVKIILHNSTPECTNCVGIRKELVNLEENVKLTDFNAFTLSAEFSKKLVPRVGILTHFVDTIIRERGTESVQVENIQLTTTNEQKIVGKKLEKATILELLQQHKNRLSSIENDNFLAEKTLQEYSESAESDKHRETANRLFEIYKKGCEPFVNALKTNIRVLEQNEPISELVRVLPYPSPFKLGKPKNDEDQTDNASECTNCVEMKKELTRHEEIVDTRYWQIFNVLVEMMQMEDRIVDMFQLVKEVIRPIMENEEPVGVEDTEAKEDQVHKSSLILLGKLRKRLLKAENVPFLRKEDKVLQEALEGKKPLEECYEAMMMHEDRKKYYKSFVNVFTRIIQILEAVLAEKPVRSVHFYTHSPLTPMPFEMADTTEKTENMQQEVLRFKRRAESTNWTIFNLQVLLANIDNWVEILIVDLMDICPHPVHETELVGAKKLKYTRKEVASKALRKQLKSRLSTAEKEYLVKADKVYEEFKERHKANELWCTAAERMYDSYVKEYKSYLVALEISIDQLQEIRNREDVLHLPEEPTFVLDDVYTLFVSLTLTGWGMEYTEKNENNGTIPPAIISRRVPEKLQELKERLEENLETKKELVHATAIFKLFLAGNTSIDCCNKAKKIYIKYKKDYETFLYALNTNIQKIETNHSTYGLLSVPNDPEPFSIVMDSADMEKMTKEAPNPWNDATNATVRKWITHSESMANALAVLKRDLKAVQEQELLEDTLKKLEVSEAIEDDPEATKSSRIFYEYYKEKYESYVNALETNIRKIEENEEVQLPDLMPIPWKPEKIEVELVADEESKDLTEDQAKRLWKIK